MAQNNTPSVDVATPANQTIPDEVSPDYVVTDYFEVASTRMHMHGHLMLTAMLAAGNSFAGDHAEVTAPAKVQPFIRPKCPPPTAPKVASEPAAAAEAPVAEAPVVESRSSVNGFERKQVVTGRVSAIKDGLGAFVKLNKKTTGLIHHGDKLGLTVGDEVLVYLSKVDPDSGKVSLRLITPEEQNFFETVNKGDEFDGTVASITETGLRVDVGAAVGFLHESKLAGGNRKEREQRRTTVEVGATVSVTVLSVDKPHYELRFVERETASARA